MQYVLFAVGPAIYMPLCVRGYVTSFKIFFNPVGGEKSITIPGHWMMLIIGAE